MKNKLSLFFTLFALSLFVTEPILRITAPELGGDLFHPPAKEKSLFLFNGRIGYEPRPFALLNPAERINSDGFRGPEYSMPKPGGVFRILAVGDSVVMTQTVPYRDTWEKKLEGMLNQKAHDARYEVINAGVGGYVSAQVLMRLKEKGLKYNPDLVLVLAGWNDLLYSTLPYWAPHMNLTAIEEAYRKGPTSDAERGKLWSNIRMPLYRHSYVARLIRHVRNKAWNARYIRNLIKSRQEDSGLAFNEEAFELYIHNLEDAYASIKSRNARMGLIVWPTVLTPELLDEPDVHERLVPVYSVFPLSTRELWAWYNKYINAQLEFALGHPDVILIDARRAFEGKVKPERLRLFRDQGHLTVEGNSVLAKAVLDGLNGEID